MARPEILAPPHKPQDKECPNYPNGCLVCSKGQKLLNAQPKTDRRFGVE